MILSVSRGGVPSVWSRVLRISVEEWVCGGVLGGEDSNDGAELAMLRPLSVPRTGGFRMICNDVCPLIWMRPTLLW